MNELRKIMRNIYLYKGCCNVYILKNEDRGITIDFGSGAVLNKLNNRSFCDR